MLRACNIRRAWEAELGAGDLCVLAEGRPGLGGNFVDKKCKVGTKRITMRLLEQVALHGSRLKRRPHGGGGGRHAAARRLRVVARLLRPGQRQRLRLACGVGGPAGGAAQAVLAREEAAVAREVDAHQGGQLFHLQAGGGRGGGGGWAVRAGR